ncbi:shikimate dehydrogenase [Chloroflexota bacterium]
MRNEHASGITRVCGVIGDPIGHSASPPMHNAAFKALTLDYYYVAFQVKKEALGKAVQGMRAFNLRGLNVTIPHKVAIIPFLDKLDPLAERIGAVNTVMNDDGVLTGYNTDAEGFLQSLLDRNIEPRGRNVIILGAGGASRAIAFVLARRGSNLLILNRTLDKARDYAARIDQAFRREARAMKLDEENLAKALTEADILINATSVGMYPHNDETPVSSHLLKPGLVVADIVYNPIETKLLREAEAAGARTVSGLDMFVWQGALAFEKWTGLKAPVEMMKEEAIKVLERREN